MRKQISQFMTNVAIIHVFTLGYQKHAELLFWIHHVTHSSSASFTECIAIHKNSENGNYRIFCTQLCGRVFTQSTYCTKLKTNCGVVRNNLFSILSNNCWWVSTCLQLSKETIAMCFALSGEFSVLWTWTVMVTFIKSVD